MSAIPIPTAANTVNRSRSLTSSMSLGALVLAAIAWLWPAAATAQLGAEGSSRIPEAAALLQVAAAPVAITAGGRAEANVALTIAPDWHINANPPSPDYMIPTTVEIKSRAGVRGESPSYPAPKMVKLGFDESQIFVYDGEAAIRLPLVASSTAVNGAHLLRGVVKFQACNDQVCLAPARIPFEITVTVTGGVAKAPEPEVAARTSTDTTVAEPDTFAHAGTPSPPSGANFATAPPAGKAARVSDNPLARALEGGGWAAFVTLFLIGLALNLTPCIYPMLGVTVSIFGARRSAPPLQVLSYALLYVLGMAVMYSALGLIAAFTGGLFGGFLQSPVVLVAIGVLLVGMALSMFGLYELQLPPALLSRLGGNTATGAIGTFASGLLVGIFAAPCIGPPVVALLAVVGAKADPWYGFTSFFTLALGLGAPYLVLGTFSNLLQALPRSGEWMVWVKKVFGVVMLGVGLFYMSLALAPAWSVWVAPAAFIVGGLYLGFLEHSGNRPGFRRLKRAAGAAAMALGILFVAATPTRGIALRPFRAEYVASALNQGRPVLLDFSADWCVPCHELERSTFSDRRVIAAARAFEAFKVDLTRYDSPESERLRKQYQINGVPTVVFISPAGNEVREARVEGFLRPDLFLQRMSLVASTDQRAATGDRSTRSIAAGGPR